MLCAFIILSNFYRSVLSRALRLACLDALQLLARGALVNTAAACFLHLSFQSAQVAQRRLHPARCGSRVRRWHAHQSSTVHWRSGCIGNVGAATAAAAAVIVKPYQCLPQHICRAAQRRNPRAAAIPADIALH